MIVLDIETSGLTGRNGIWQIGAIELENSRNYFLQESRIDDEDEVTEGAMKVHGKTEKYLRNLKKQSQKQMIMNYLVWVLEVKEKIFLGQNTGWDVSMIQDKTIKYGLEKRFIDIHGQRTLDLHTIAQEKYKKIKGIYLLDKNGKSAMNLSRVLEFCGLPDERINVRGNEVVKEGKHHDALDDCKLEGECYWRLEEGKNLFPEYSQFPVPHYLTKPNGVFIRK